MNVLSTRGRDSQRSAGRCDVRLCCGVQIVVGQDPCNVDRARGRFGIAGREVRGWRFVS